MRLEWGIHPRKVALILAILSFYFAVQSLIAEYLIENVLDNDAYRSLVLTIDLFSVNAEQTIPTWYAVLLLFGAAVLLAWIAIAKRSQGDCYWRYWIGLAVLFLYLSMDEGAAIHEILADGLQNTLNLTGFLTFGWQIVAAPLVLLFAVLYLRFLLHLPRRTRNLFIVAGIVYVGGALVVEGISANQYDAGGGVTFNYLAIATVEESCEMLGVVVFIYALLDYIVDRDYAVALYPQVPAPTTEAISSVAPAPSNAVVPASKPRWQLPSLSLKRFASAVAVIIIGLNFVLVSWAFSTPPPQQPAANSAWSTLVIIDQLATDGVLVTRLAGTFSSDNLASRRVAKALLEIYQEVMVITVNSSYVSIALAADDLPFDQEQLSNLLRENGETQFVIFDTHAVQLIVGNI